ncbi:hypothetical protein [Rivularia sp. UHCC 0363]|uniref:hypothetical protein n=1 Tax=Rivularia sp. UHCC 0363 TaxID=3110244 RepID=UPI002B21983C|nr:hypothetical protein [Rivularia sp. UHCC 0363]MEA5595704.1 hypothetical protein [Rivularia sp. UHCC 0363]
MFKKSLLFLLLISLFPQAAFAQVKGYLGKDGYFNIRGLNANQAYQINLEGMPLIRAGRSNSCGVLRVAISGAVKTSDKIEIHDVRANKFYGFANTQSIPVEEFTCKPGEVKPGRDIWKDEKGTLWISGLTPSSAQTIRLLSENSTRKIRANSCGFISLRLANPQPPGLVVDDNQAFQIDGANSGGGIVCRRGKLYVAYPPEPEIAPVSAATWKQNPLSQISFASYTAIATITGVSNGGGGGTNWSEPPSQPPPPPVFNPPEEEPPPPPPEEPPPPPPEEPPPPPPEEPPPPPPPPTKPQPPQGQRMCKVGSQFIVLQLTPGVEYEADEDDTRTPPRQAIADSTGRAEFENINFEKEYEGVPAGLYVWERNSERTVISTRVSIVQPCQNQ